MGKLARTRVLGTVLLSCSMTACGDDRAGAPPPDPIERAAAPPATPGDDPATACGALAKALDEFDRLVAAAQEVPRDRALYALAARFAQARRTIEITQHELDIVDREAAAPDFVMRPGDYRARRKLERARLEGVLDEALAADAALRDEAARSRFPAVAGDDGPALVLDSIRWRDAAAHVARFRAACATAPAKVDATALRDFVSGMALVGGDGHGVATRALERRLLAGDDLARSLP